MYEELYAPIPDLQACLERVNMGDVKPELTLDYLNRLIYAQAIHVPFENIDAWAEGKCPDLGIEALFDKIVTRRRGGWCFELNAYFHALLEAIGFECYGLGIRVSLGSKERTTMSHHAEMVICEGKKYVCDMGFGTVSMREAVPLDGSMTPHGFHIEPYGDGEYMLYHTEGGVTKDLMRFEDRAVYPVDYVLANFYHSQNTEGPFRLNLSCSILTPDCRKQLVNYTMKEYVDGNAVRVTTAADKTELSALLLEHFGIDYKLA